MDLFTSTEDNCLKGINICCNYQEKKPLSLFPFFLRNITRTKCLLFNVQALSTRLCGVLYELQRTPNCLGHFENLGLLCKGISRVPIEQVISANLITWRDKGRKETGLAKTLYCFHSQAFSCDL